MRLASFNDGRVGFVQDGHVREVIDFAAARPGEHSAMRRLIASMPDGRAPGDLALGSPVPLDDVTLLPPVPDPTKVFAAPVNYADHQAEMNESVQVSGLGLFLKAPSSLVGSGGQVRLPYVDRRFDQEGEVAVVIGRRARHVTREDALDHVFGCTALLDMTMRGREDRSTRKSFETFTPMGPWLVTSDDIGDLGALDFTCRVGSEVRQKSTTADLVWGFAELVAYASSITTLEPGDVITSGTPAGVAPVADGDTITVEIAGVGGALTVSVTAVQAVACPTSGHRP